MEVGPIAGALGDGENRPLAGIGSIDPQKIVLSVLVLGEAVGNFVIVAFFRDEDMNFYLGLGRAVEGAHGPPITSQKMGPQNKLDPQVLPKSRRSWGEDVYQVILSAPWMVNAVLGITVETK